MLLGYKLLHGNNYQVLETPHKKCANVSKNCFKKLFRHHYVKNNIVFFFLVIFTNEQDLGKSIYNMYLTKCVTLEMKSRITGFYMNSKHKSRSECVEVLILYSPFTLCPLPLYHLYQRITLLSSQRSKLKPKICPDFPPSLIHIRYLNSKTRLAIMSLLPHCQAHSCETHHLLPQGLSRASADLTKQTVPD